VRRGCAALTCANGVRQWSGYRLSLIAGRPVISAGHPIHTWQLAKSSCANKGPIMKSNTHPKYEAVVFNDLASGVKFLTKSTVSSKKTIEWEDGNTYPVIDVEISSESHPFYTGKQRIMDSAGRVERFNARFKGFGGKK
jgi:large subunit ribosomal protein L31